VIHTTHEANLTLGHFVKVRLVSRGLKGQPYVATERDDGRPELGLTLIHIVVPSHGYVREPKQEEEHPQVFGWEKPIAARKGCGKNHALDVKLERSSGEYTSSHYCML